MSLRSRHTFLPSGILIHRATWPQQILCENWGAVPLWQGGPGSSPSNTVWPGPRPTCSLPSFILIHPTVWPQYINVTNRQDRRRDRTDRRRSDSIERTVLQTVAPKRIFSICCCRAMLPVWCIFAARGSPTWTNVKTVWTCNWTVFNFVDLNCCRIILLHFVMLTC